jgi:hypothetical protein
MKAIILSPLLFSAAFGVTIGQKLHSRQTTANLWQPEVGAKIQMILTGIVTVERRFVPRGVSIFDVDLFDTPPSNIQALKSQGINVICYFSAGTSENWRPDYDNFTSADKGAALPDWQGENYLNLRSANVLEVMSRRIEKASSAGCDAIDPDNLGKSSQLSGLIKESTFQTSVCRWLLKRWRRIQSHFKRFDYVLASPCC